MYSNADEAIQEFEHVAALLRLARKDVDFQQETLEFYNLVEIRRLGGSYEDWLERMGNA